MPNPSHAAEEICIQRPIALIRFASAGNRFGAQLVGSRRRRRKRTGRLRTRRPVASSQPCYEPGRACGAVSVSHGRTAWLATGSAVCLPSSAVDPYAGSFSARLRKVIDQRGTGQLGYAVFPFVPRLAAQMVNRSGLQLGGSPTKTAGPASSETHRRRRPKRNADDVSEYGAIPVPTDPGGRIIPDQQGLNEVIGFETCEPPGGPASPGGVSVTPSQTDRTLFIPVRQLVSNAVGVCYSYTTLLLQPVSSAPHTPDKSAAGFLRRLCKTDARRSGRGDITAWRCSRRRDYHRGKAGSAEAAPRRQILCNLDRGVRQAQPRSKLLCRQRRRSVFHQRCRVRGSRHPRAPLLR